eukprot:3958703-Alexandrium_andersonii.AAC.1
MKEKRARQVRMLATARLISPPPSRLAACRRHGRAGRQNACHWAEAARANCKPGAAGNRRVARSRPGELANGRLFSLRSLPR